MNEGTKLVDHLAHGRNSLTLFEGTQNDTSPAPKEENQSTYQATACLLTRKFTSAGSVG